MSSNRWSDDETRGLLSVWSATEIQAKFDGTVRDAEVYRNISDLLAELGVHPLQQFFPHLPADIARKYYSEPSSCREFGVCL